MISGDEEIVWVRFLARANISLKFRRGNKQKIDANLHPSFYTDTYSMISGDKEIVRVMFLMFLAQATVSITFRKRQQTEYLCQPSSFFLY